MKTRTQILCETVRGKKVLHVGFADYPDFRQKIDRDTFLHYHLMGVCSVWGVDTHTDSVRWFKAQGVNYITHDPDQLPEDFDYILFGEILEHVNDPVALLIEYKYRFPLAGVIATVPNAYRLRNVFDALKGEENVNPDHRCWYSPQTISKVFELAGYLPETQMVESYPRGPIRRFILTKFPLLKDTVIVQA